MAQNIDIPKDAFIVKDRNTKYCDAQWGEPAFKKYKKFYEQLLDSGVGITQATIQANGEMERYFNEYMQKYYLSYKEYPDMER